MLHDIYLHSFSYNPLFPTPLSHPTLPYPLFFPSLTAPHPTPLSFTHTQPSLYSTPPHSLLPHSLLTLLHPTLLYPPLPQDIGRVPPIPRDFIFGWLFAIFQVNIINCYLIFLLLFTVIFQINIIYNYNYCYCLLFTVILI